MVGLSNDETDLSSCSLHMLVKLVILVILVVLDKGTICLRSRFNPITVFVDLGFLVIFLS